MKVAVYYNNSDIRIEERPIPAISPGEILVKMEACGICGTDIMEWYRIKKGPRVLGHEMAGSIVDVGEGVEGYKKGDRVFVSHHVPCYECHYCKAGNYTACEQLHTGNFDPGGFSEFIRVPAENVKYGTFILPPEMTYYDASMIEPLGCAIRGQKLVNLKKSHSVLIIGSGISGLLHIQLAKLNGSKVIATDISKYRLQIAEKFGADVVFDANNYSVDDLKRTNNGRLADIVIVCAGADKAISNALLSVDRNGTILFFTISNKDITLPSVRFWRDEIAVRFSYGAAPDDLKDSLELIKNGKINVREMVTHRIPLTKIKEGFRLAVNGKDSLKVVVVPD
ncbi:MAG: alcohol dehydrogenase catalytic domain-containing protein [Actinomycetota bacterium]|nr:alcohol dehydrogenase catalytic domain-containing protein [Actinomycetota bacterium]